MVLFFYRQEGFVLNVPFITNRKMMIDNFTNTVENIHDLIRSKFVCCLLGCSSKHIDSLTEMGTDTQRTQYTSMMGIQKRGRFSSYVDKKDSAFPLCRQKRGRYSSMRTEKRAFFLYTDKKEGDFPLCGQKRGRF